MSATCVPWYVPRGYTGLSRHGDPVFPNFGPLNQNPARVRRREGRYHGRLTQPPVGAGLRPGNPGHLSPSLTSVRGLGTPDACHRIPRSDVGGPRSGPRQTPVHYLRPCGECIVWKMDAPLPVIAQVGTALIPRAVGQGGGGGTKQQPATGSNTSQVSTGAWQTRSTGPRPSGRLQGLSQTYPSGAHTTTLQT